MSIMHTRLRAHVYAPVYRHLYAHAYTRVYAHVYTLENKCRYAHRCTHF